MPCCRAFPPLALYAFAVLGVFGGILWNLITALFTGLYARIEGTSTAKFNRGLVLSAIVLALPFTACATYMWLTASSSYVTAQDSYQVGDGIYALGAPLTLIVLGYGYLGGIGDSAHWWAIPLLDYLFVFQWAMRGRLSALIIQRVGHLEPVRQNAETREETGSWRRVPPVGPVHALNEPFKPGDHRTNLVALRR